MASRSKLFFVYVGATVITHLFGLGLMAPESHPIMLLERIRNCRYYWQLYIFELLRMYLSCTHTPLDSAPSKPLRPLIHLAARFAFTRTAFTAFTFFVSHSFLLFVVYGSSITSGSQIKPPTSSIESWFSKMSSRCSSTNSRVTGSPSSAHASM